MGNRKEMLRHIRDVIVHILISLTIIRLREGEVPTPRYISTDSFLRAAALSLPLAAIPRGMQQAQGGGL